MILQAGGLKKKSAELRGIFIHRPEACNEGRSETLRPTRDDKVNWKLRGGKSIVLGRRPVKNDVARRYAEQQQ